MSRRSVPGCDICVCKEDLPNHKGSLQHRFNFALFEWNGYRRAIVKNRNGIEIEVKLHNIATNRNDLVYKVEEKKGRHGVTVLEQRARVEMVQNNGISYIFTVLNKQRSKSILLMGAMLLHPNNNFTLEDFEGKMTKNSIFKLEPNATYSFKVTFKLNRVKISTFAMPVAIHLQTETNENDGANFTIYREMHINIIGALEFNQEAAVVEKNPFTSALWHQEISEWVEPLVRIPFQNTFTIPLKYKKIFKMGITRYQSISPEEEISLRDVEHLIHPGYVTQHNYQDFFHIALWVDETAAELMLQRYNMENVNIQVIQKSLLELEVPGLGEKRPSLIKGDVVNLRLQGDHIGYKGVVSRVNNVSIYIQGVDELLVEYIRSNPDAEIDVSFQLGRLPYERMHNGVNHCVSSGITNYLFPDNVIANVGVLLGRRLPDYEFFNPSIRANPEQRSAVESILFRSSNYAPYIVFGPPGTGKTITIVEAILQLVKKIPGVVILVCAPANAACDMLASKLIQSNRLTEKELIRVHSDTREWDTVPEEVRGYSNYVDGEYIKPRGFELMKYRVIVTTLILSGRYQNDYLKPNYLFIDEAAQAMEPEADVAIGLLSPRSHLILAGDPKQLGPICQSKVADKLGLNISLLERLMKFPLYASNNVNVITTLKLNFRAHPEVLQIPNELFYENQLKAVSRNALLDPIARICVHDKFIHRKAKNLIEPSCLEFVAVFAKEMRQGRSPSYFNPKEAEMVIKYVSALLSLQETKVLQSEIGIVTPYIRQVYRVKELLAKNNYTDVEVGTTEVFQGREKRIIIISTVRAQYDLLLYDRKYKLGFVANEKRFNVALTRAMSKLIIIGCPNVLQYDDNWLKFIQDCEAKQSYFGSRRDVRHDNLKQDVIKRLNNVYPRDQQYKKVP